ncbi:MAG TPA: oligosaccharide flippase family protein, partial [Phenylobacterium sp.]
MAERPMAEGAERDVVRRIYGNLGRLLGGKAGAGLLSLGYLAVAARALGPTDYGVLVLVHAYAMTVGGIVEFPGWHAVVRYGAQARAAGDRPRLTRLLAFAGLVEGAGGLLAVVVAAVLAPIVGPALGWSPTAIAFALPYSLAVLASIRATPAGYLQLTGRFDLLGAHNLVAPAVRLVGSLIAIAAHAGLKGFLIAWLAAALAEWAAMWGLGAWVAWGQHARSDLRGGLGRVPRENPGLWRFMLAANADVTVSELSGRLSPLAVGWILGPAAAGLYAVAQRATAVLAQPAQILGQAAYAELANLAAAGDRGPRIRAAVVRAVGVALLAAAPVCLLIALFGRPLAV